MKRTGNTKLEVLNRRIEGCGRCPRLVRHCRAVARVKRAAYRGEEYHGGPVGNFVGEGELRVLVVGLAPGAHGANRTGRMFTGDRSGDFLYRAMFEAGFASQASSVRRGDGLKLMGSAVTAACHCAPPGNKPAPEELKKCEGWLEETFELMPGTRVVVCLGRIAFESVMKLYVRRGWIEKRARYRFGHGAEFAIEGAPTVICSYHPSQQNTFTGRLTDRMLLDVFRRAKVVSQSA